MKKVISIILVLSIMCGFSAFTCVNAEVKNPVLTDEIEELINPSVKLYPTSDDVQYECYGENNGYSICLYLKDSSADTTQDVQIDCYVFTYPAKLHSSDYPPLYAFNLETNECYRLKEAYEKKLIDIDAVAKMYPDSRYLGEEYEQCFDAIWERYRSDDEYYDGDFYIDYGGEYNGYQICAYFSITCDSPCVSCIGDTVFTKSSEALPYKLAIHFVKKGTALTLKEAYDKGVADLNDSNLLSLICDTARLGIVAYVVDDCVDNVTAENVGYNLFGLYDKLHQPAYIYGEINDCVVVGYENNDSKGEFITVGDYVVYDDINLYYVKGYKTYSVDFSTEISDFTIEQLAEVAPNVRHKNDVDEPTSTPDVAEPTSTPDVAEPTTNPSEPTTLPDTSEPTTNPSEPSVTVPDDMLLGDADCDKSVDIKDATLIQKAIAELQALSDIQTILSDVNNDGKINISDVTLIQKHIADIDTGYKIGLPYKTA